MNKKIVVIGSSNIDLFMKVKNIPKPGETIIGGEIYKAFGGKGANQAVAAARTLSDVTFISSIGKDTEGVNVLNNLLNEGIDISKIEQKTTKPTGMALIFVDQYGENSIAVSSGANSDLSESDIIKHACVIKDADIVLVQLEIPLNTVKAALKIAKDNNVKVILNPAPALKIEDELYKYVSIIAPNIHEAESLTGIKIKSKNDALTASNVLFEKGVKNVIITNGVHGVYICSEGEIEFIPSFPVKTIDTTGAGDVFIGVLASSIAKGFEISEAVKYANAAAAISVTRRGAQNSAPTMSEINAFLLDQTDSKSFIHINGVENEKN
jgi:ribokinase